MFFGLVNLFTPPCKEVPASLRYGKPVADRLRAARALIVKGWTQHATTRMIDGTMRYCTSGAISAVFPVVNTLWSSLRCSADTRKVFAEANGLTWIAPWNDCWWRTKRSVLRAFDRAIAYAETH